MPRFGTQNRGLALAGQLIPVQAADAKRLTSDKARIAPQPVFEPRELNPKLRLCSPRFRVPQRQRGFTLIEVMAAFAIFAVLFGVILQILSTSVSNTRRSGDFTQAALIAQAQLDMVGIEEIPLPGSYSGEQGERYRWVMDIEPYFVTNDSGVSYDELPIDLYRVVLTVYWGENDRERSAMFQTLRSVDRFYAERQLDAGS